MQTETGSFQIPKRFLICGKYAWEIYADMPFYMERRTSKITAREPGSPYLCRLRFGVVYHRIVLFSFAVLIAATCSCVAETLLDWDQFTPEVPLTSLHDQFYISIAEPEKSFVVGVESSPKNPFSETQSSLYVDNDTTVASFRIWCRAFIDEGKLVGSFEFPFRLEEGELNFVIGQNSQTFIPKEVGALGFASQDRPDDQYFAVTLVAGEPITIGAEQLRSASIERLLPETNHLLRVEWDFTAEPPGFRFYLNREPLILISSGDDYFRPATDIQIKKGVDSCAFVNPINAARSKYFLGPLTIKASSHP